MSLYPWQCTFKLPLSASSCDGLHVAISVLYGAEMSLHH